MTGQGDAENRAENVLRLIASCDLAGLMAIWRARDVADWSRAPELYRGLSEAILKRGEPLLAYDVIKEGLGALPSDVRLRQLQGLSLARSGATDRANAILESLRKEGQADEETLGMLGRTYKDLAMHATSVAARRQNLERAAKIYAEGFQSTGGYWSGINAATMNLLIGNVDTASALAAKVREQCKKLVSAKDGNNYWALAAMGEVALIVKDWSEAEDWYGRATLAGVTGYGDVCSTRRNAHLILQYWQAEANRIDRILRIPPVVAFAGHMIDRVDRVTPRFPESMEGAVAAQIGAWIDRVQPKFGFASAACGSDILFLEAMLQRGAEVSVVLPYNEEEFVPDSVDFVPGSDWPARFRGVLARATRVLTASTAKLAIGGVSYEFCNQFLLGLGAIRARQLETDLIPLVVWNGQPGDGPGGASSVVENWRALGYEPEIIFLEKRETEATACSSPAQVEKPARNSGFNSRLVAILFADAVGFSKLSETEVPLFVEKFLGAIARLSANFTSSILAKNTWGDGLYFIFSAVEPAGGFALQLADMTTRTNWEEKGLPAGLNLRIALHAGPAYEFNDPITGDRTYGGTHVSRAARLEPITPAGQVYSSEAFAALAAALRSSHLRSEYVGQTPMAKGYGTLPTYHVRRRAAVR